MEEPDTREAASFISQSGFTKPGYQALLAVKKMQKDAAEAVAAGDTMGAYQDTLYRAGEVWVRINYSHYRDWTTIDVWTTRFPDDVYDYFLTGEASEDIFDSRATKHSNSLSAKDPARIVASVNSLARKVAADREKYIILADVRKKCADLPKGVPEKWNAESKALGLWPASGFTDMNLKQAKVLAAWVEGKLTGLKAQKESLARQVVSAMLESEVEDFVAYLRELPSKQLTDRDYVYKIDVNPKTRHLDVDYDDYTKFNVFARRGVKGGKIPWIGKIAVRHRQEDNVPVWNVDTIWSETWPGGIVDHDFSTRLEAANALWNFYTRDSKFKNILPPEPLPF